MRRLIIVCFAIASLALASGAPADGQSSAHTKSFDVGDKEKISLNNLFDKDVLVILSCDVHKCKVSSVSQDQTTMRSCDLNQKYLDISYEMSIFDAGNSRAVIAVRDGVAKIKLISVNLRECHATETSIDAQKQLANNSHTLNVFFVPHEDNYDVIYKNKEICPSFCKATIDYEGKVVKAASEFHAKPFEAGYMYIIEANKTYLVAENTEDAGVVLVTKDGDKEPTILYDGEKAGYALSVAENKLGFCVYRNRKLSCKQYDAEGKTKKIDVEIETGEKNLKGFQVLNLKKGFLTLMLDRGQLADNMYVVHFDEQGRQGKYIRIDPKCNENSRIIPKLYKNASGQYCATSFCILIFGSVEDKSNFTQTTRCFHQNELF